MTGNPSILETRYHACPAQTPLHDFGANLNSSKHERTVAGDQSNLLSSTSNSSVVDYCPSALVINMALLVTAVKVLQVFISQSGTLIAEHYMTRLLSVVVAYLSLLALFRQSYRRFFGKHPLIIYNRVLQRTVDGKTLSASPIPSEVDPLSTFDYKTIPPTPYRPFKTNRHVTMGLRKIPKTASIKIDQRYLTRITYRKHLIATHPSLTVGTSPHANPAIAELYTDLILSFLPQRYPTLFHLTDSTFTNLITGISYSIAHAQRSSAEMLRQLGENVEEDFYLMVPDPSCNNSFKLQGYISAFPQGLLSKAKVGMTVREIHQPVPGYEQRLGNGVDRCFARMKPGEYVGRLNWSIQGNGDELYLPYAGNSAPDPSSSPTSGSQIKEVVDFDKSFLRVEHHTLHTLPQTGAVIFAVRSYLTPLKEIKEEGSGVELAEGIESMPSALGRYKRRDIWGASVETWLRGE